MRPSPATAGGALLLPPPDRHSNTLTVIPPKTVIPAQAGISLRLCASASKFPPSMPITPLTRTPVRRCHPLVGYEFPSASQPNRANAHRRLKTAFPVCQESVPSKEPVVHGPSATQVASAGTTRCGRCPRKVVSMSKAQALAPRPRTKNQSGVKATRKTAGRRR